MLSWSAPTVSKFREDDPTTIEAQTHQTTELRERAVRAETEIMVLVRDRQRVDALMCHNRVPSTRSWTCQEGERLNLC